MYACILKPVRGFFEGVCTPSNAIANFHDPPPPPHNSRIDSGRYFTCCSIPLILRQEEGRSSESPDRRIYLHTFTQISSLCT